MPRPRKRKRHPLKRNLKRPDATSGDEKKNVAVAEPDKPTESSSGFSNSSEDANAGSNSPGKIFNPIHWTFHSEKKGDGLYAFIAEAVIDPGWHLYAQGIEVDLGPTFTSFKFEGNKQLCAGRKDSRTK
jgi:hypothetical protein